MSVDLPPVQTTGIGSWPGTDMVDAIKITFAECPELPYLPELPGRGAHAQLVGRSTAFLAGLAVDLQPAGWRLTDGSGRDHRLAISTLRADLDQLEEQVQGYAGPVKFAVAGPWTLAAMMERPRGDKVLADSGARRDLGQSLAEGVAQLIMEIRRRLPDIEPLVQLDEPLLPRVLAGDIPTASGFSRHRFVDIPEVSAMISELVDRLRETSATPTAVHCCAAAAPDRVAVEGRCVDRSGRSRPADQPGLGCHRAGDGGRAAARRGCAADRSQRQLPTRWPGRSCARCATSQSIRRPPPNS